MIRVLSGRVLAGLFSGLLALGGVGCADHTAMSRDAELYNQQNEMLQAQNLRAQAELDAMARQRAEDGAKIQQMDGKIGELNNRLTDLANRPVPSNTIVKESTQSERTVIQRFDLESDVLFSSGQAALKPAAQARLKEIARTIKSKYAGHTVRVDGHTDSDPIRKSKWGSNKALSEARANAVKTFLKQQGVTNSISVQGLGESKPKASNKTREGKAQNRRVEIRIFA